MNFLAHAYLSFGDNNLLLGNMVSDFVKGSRQFNFPEAIRMGIALHRRIDAYTDAHPATSIAKDILKPAAHRYAGPFVDVIYDHFLATDDAVFSDASLLEFSVDTYAALEQQRQWFPQSFTFVFDRMKQDNWLYNYSTAYGTQRSFQGLYRRSKYLEDWQPVYDCFQENYAALKNCYQSFFPDVDLFARTSIEHINANQGRY